MTITTHPRGVLEAEQARDIAEARAEFEYQARKMADIAGFAALRDAVPEQAYRETWPEYVKARDAYLRLVGAL